MRVRLLVCALAAVALGACGKETTSAGNANLTGPSDVKITAPVAGLARDIAAFSGTWQGKWDGTLPSRLIVEQITNTNARVVYEWGTIPGVSGAGWLRLEATVQPGPKLQWGRPGIARFTFAIDTTQNVIVGTRETPQMTNYVTMKRVG